MKPFSLLIKPAGADCNLRCAYCFYLDRGELYPDTARHRMPPDVLEHVIASFMALDQPQYVFNWQGGEPTLMGVDFFREVTRLQQKHGRDGAIVGNSLQTNATLIDDGLAAHLAEYKFLVGVSIDGPADVHDQFRTSAGGRGSHADVLHGIECLRRNRVEFNALVLVSSANVDRAGEVYRYLRDLGIFHHQYIPCVEFDDAGEPLPHAVSGSQWGSFLCEVFDEWIGGDVRKVSVRHFDAVLSVMVNGKADACHMSRNCCQYLVVEHNGDIYPCDFFVDADKRLGNVMTDSWDALLQSAEYLKFGRQKAAWHTRCAGCEYLTYCAGDCLKRRIYAGNDSKQLSWLCDGWRQFYGHTLSAFSDLAESVRRDRQRMLQGSSTSAARVIGPRPSRNDPCPCGSGRKHKRCCGR